MLYADPHGGPGHETIDAGWLFSVAYSRRLLDGAGKKPFMLLSISGGGSGAGIHPMTPQPASPGGQLYAFDIRAGLTVGKTFYRTISPYGSLRLFGGPIFWHEYGDTKLGTDQRHVQLAVGMVAALPKSFDMFAEVAPLFERGVTVGVGKSF